MLRLPPGTLEYAEWWGLAGGLAPGRARDAVLSGLELRPPPPPLPWADGSLCCQVGEGEDEESWSRLRAILPPGTSAADAAARAQEWRLPVTDYARRADVRAASGADAMCRVAALPVAAPKRPPVVVDLTALWAGPLATSLMAARGWRVIKIDPSCRPDGMRGGPLGERLNGGKEVVDLDLRLPEQRAAFLDLVAGADIVIDSFSPRVMPNLGLDHAALAAVNPSVTTISMPAFPSGSPWHGWVGYGPHVHAMSGLGDAGEGTFWSPSVAYPDPIAGLVAFAVALRRVGRPGHLEVSLWSATEPIMDRAA